MVNYLGDKKSKIMKELILKYRTVILAVILIITAALGYFIKDIKIDADFLNYLPKDDKAAILFKEVGREFGGTYTGVIALKSDNVFSTQTLQDVQAITDTLENYPGISSVVSLTNVIDIKNDGGLVTIDNLMDEIPQSKEELDTLKRYVLCKDMYNGILVSPDAKMIIIAVKFQEDITEAVDTSLTADSLQKYYAEYYPAPVYHTVIKNDTAYITVDKMEIVKGIKSVVSTIKPKEKVLYGGLPFMTKDVSDVIVHDVITLGPIAFLVILLILVFSFKKFDDSILPLVNVVIAILWTIGIMAILGYKLTMVSSTIPVVLLAVGSAYTIHVINHINNAQGSNIKEKIKNSLGQVAVPVFFASVTTIVGFISFIFGSYLTMISEFGLFSALGIGLSLVFSLVLTPIIKSYGTGLTKSKQKPDKNKNGKLLTPYLTKLAHQISETQFVFIIFWLVMVIMFIFGISKIQRNVDLLTYLKKDNPSRLAELEIRKEIGGTIPVYVLVKGDILTPETLKQMEDVKNYMNSLPDIENSQSVADMIKEMNKVMGDGDKIPDTKDKIDNLWFMLEGQDILNQYITPDYNSAVVQGIVTSSDTRVMHKIMDELNSYLEKKHYTNMQVTGFPVIYTRLDESLLASQKYSLLISIILVFILISLMLKSIKQGLGAIIPIIVTLIILFGSMGILGIPLDVATVLVGSVSIGIGIDYAIHFSNSLSKNIKKYDYKQAVTETMRITGRSIIINMLSVMLGFLVMVFADLVPLQYFGILVGITMLTSALSTITILPVLKLVNNKSKKS